MWQWVRGPPVSSLLQMKMSRSLVTLHLMRQVFHLLPFTKAAVNEVTFPVTSGHYYPVIMCCSAWLHLLFLADRLMLEKSNST